MKPNATDATSANAMVCAPPPPPGSGVSRPTSGIARYQGTWDATTAKQLLRTTVIGPTKTQTNALALLSMDAAVERILTPLPRVDPPICISPGAGDIENLPWHLSTQRGNQFNRKKSLQCWMVKNILHADTSVGENLLLFWHNHLVTGIDAVNDARFTYYYIQLLRQHALGNFKTLVREISTHAAMLKYLSGDQNKKGAPNENYARELLELFTLGAEDINGNPNYTEADVEEAAKVLTGWETRHQGNGTFLNPHTRFNANQHETGAKTFSSHFNNQTIHRSLPNQYERELDDLIDMIFDREEVALFLVRQLYTWFVYYDIDSNTESHVIAPLAQILRDNDYDVKPVLRTLFKSQHFYDAHAAGTVVKNPASYVLGSIRQFETPEPLNFPKEAYMVYYRVHQWMLDMQMELLNPPNVAGWSAYYQSPGYYQRWINTATYNARSSFAHVFLRQGIYSATTRYKPNLPLFVQSITGMQAHDINVLIQSAVDLLLPVDITSNQKQYLKDILLNGLPDFEWTVEWSQYMLTAVQASNPTSVAMRKKLEDFFYEIMNMAEYHLN